MAATGLWEYGIGKACEGKLGWVWFWATGKASHTMGTLLDFGFQRGFLFDINMGYLHIPSFFFGVSGSCLVSGAFVLARARTT